MVVGRSAVLGRLATVLGRCDPVVVAGGNMDSQATISTSAQVVIDMTCYTSGKTVFSDHQIPQPRLSKEASSVLIDLGEAVQSNATHDEVGVLIDGTLLQEVYVRNACLQAIQINTYKIKNLHVIREQRKVSPTVWY
ncbi:uncharacterized protein F5147DRAFT_656171 [Suillus discolor]|uniref:Uncharacterized protein n=1 Tax=Suillus discolor TaxID=1912936 RepID=A0A9P7EYW5_9AGAM|nr:uncharacterized protein F5147DRAFT_656171 [Suillus discolor]KAG2097919.1 hypothetical protein F5147DRAFT_656171 [Suillus discolor]